MSNLEKDLLAALVELDTAVAAFSGQGTKQDLQPLFKRIDRLAGELPKTSNPNLLHYLHKKSYQKARLFLEGRDAENTQGNCRHV
jgi:hypothetical protein